MVMEMEEIVQVQGKLMEGLTLEEFLQEKMVLDLNPKVLDQIIIIALVMRHVDMGDVNQSIMNLMAKKVLGQEDLVKTALEEVMWESMALDQEEVVEMDLEVTVQEEVELYQE